MNSEAKVAGHYTRGGLEETILRAAARMGLDTDRLNAIDLAAADEFHVGGLDATRELAAHMELEPGLRILDVGRASADRPAISLQSTGAKSPGWT